jgi:YD repeat-containing protein
MVVGRISSRVWAAAALCAVVFGPAGAEELRYRYDALGRLAGVARSDGSQVLYTYDAAGNRTAVTAWPGSQLATYDFAASRGYGAMQVHPRMLADVDGDGRDDLVAVGNDYTYVGLGKADGTFATTIFGGPIFSPAQGWTDDNLTPRMTADVAGGAGAELVGFAPDGVYVAQWQASGGFGPAVKKLDGFGTTAGGWTNQDVVPRMLADVNGDGKADVVGFAYGSVLVALAYNGAFAAPYTATQQFVYADSWTSQNVYPRVVVDVNGDGRADIVGFSADGVKVALAQPNGTFGAAVTVLQEFGTNAGGWVNNQTNPRFVVDVNNDGKPDIVGFGNEYVYIAHGKGDGTFDKTIARLSPYVASWGSQGARPRFVGDVDGDGLAELLAVGADGVYRQAGPL